MNKKSILIIGGGIGGSIFVKNLLFYDDLKIELSSNSVNGKTFKLAKEFEIPFTLIEELIKENSLNRFDIIVICTPPGTKLPIVDNLITKGYKNALIIEKPISLYVDRAKKMQEMITNNGNKSIVAVSRRFMDNFEKFKSGAYEIEWPIMDDINVDTITHILPHALDLLCIIEEDDDLMVENVIYTKHNDYRISGYINRKPFYLNMYHTNNRTPITINGKEHKLLINQVIRKRMIDSFELKTNPSTDIFSCHIKIASILEKVIFLRERGGI